jgi:hypothetical protein
MFEHPSMWSRTASTSFVALVVFAAWATGCRCDRSPTPPPPPSDACQPLASEPGETLYPIHAPRDVKLEVHTLGRPPRRRLRYAFAAGARFSFEVLPIQDETDRGDADGMTILVEGNVACRARDGTSRLDYRLGLRGVLQDGARAYAILDDRGFVREGGLLATVPVDARGVTHPREGMPIQLPDEPVGEGAVWTIGRTLDSGVRQNTTFEVTKIDDDLVATKVSIEATIPSGASASPGAGHANIDLNRPVSTGWFLLEGTEGARVGLRVVPR